MFFLGFRNAFIKQKKEPIAKMYRLPISIQNIIGFSVLLKSLGRIDPKSDKIPPSISPFVAKYPKNIVINSSVILFFTNFPSSKLFNKIIDIVISLKNLEVKICFFYGIANNRL